MEDVTRGGMYLVIPAAVAEDTRLRERSKLIYGRIVQLAASTGFCYASNQALLEILAKGPCKAFLRSCGTGGISTWTPARSPAPAGRGP